MNILGKIGRTLRTAGQQARPFRFVASRALVKTGLCSRLIIERDGYRVRFHPSNVSVSMWMQGRHYFAWEERFIQRLLREGDTFVDVGANIGNLAIAGKLKVRTGKVVAIEAHPRTFSFLASNIALNELDIDAKNVAVGDQAGTLRFSDLHADDCNGVDLAGGGISVPVEALDTLLSGLAAIRLLKIDIEGYELPALFGAKEVLQRTDFVYFELWDQLTRRYHYDPADLLGFLRGAGFAIRRVLPDGSWVDLPADADFSKLENYLAVRTT